MAKDRMNSEPDDLVPSDDSTDGSKTGQNGEAVGDTNEKSRRAARVAAIKKAVDAGDYDSDELLEIALRRMIQGLPSDGDD